jgi:hypothetical protein
MGVAARSNASGPAALPLSFYGFSPDNPILCFDPVGERAFLCASKCPNGHPLYGRRIGSMSGRCPAPALHVDELRKIHPSGPCIVDRYDCVCASREYHCTLYFDMYHPETAAPEAAGGAPPEDSGRLDPTAGKFNPPAIQPAQLRGRAEIIGAFTISDDRFDLLYECYQYALGKSGAKAQWNDDIEAYCRSIAALSEAEIELAKTDLDRAITNRIITRLIDDARRGQLKR